MRDEQTHMAGLTGFNGTSDTIHNKARTNIFHIKKLIKPATIPQFASKNQAQGTNMNGFPMETTRRAAIGLAAIIFSGQLNAGILLADDGENRYWIDGPIPIPPIYNNIANKETGTRSFLKKGGVYMANIGPTGSAYRLRQYAFDLLALRDLLESDAWNYVRRYLRLKSTFMYYDFDKVISAAPVDQKGPLTDLANNLFDNVEKLEDAVKKHSLPETKSCYEDTAIVLQEVMTRMA